MCIRDTPNGDVPTDALTWRERHAFGRLLSLVRRDGYAPPVLTQLTQGAWGSFPDVIDGLFPAGMGDRANDIITKYSYEPEFGQLATESDPRYTVSADPNALNEHPQHDATLTRYAHAGATQLLSEIRHPTPTLPDGTQGAGVIEQFTDYDSRGRLLRQVNAVGAVTAYSYVPEDPGDVRSGYPQQVVEDAGGLAITTTHAVDERGRVVETTLPRGVNLADGRFHVRTVYNELDQIIETVSSPPFAFVTRRFYDRTGNLEREERPVEDENGIAILGGMEQRTFCYDQEFKLKEESLGGADRDEHLVAFHHYDHAGLRVSTTLPEGNQLRAGYDGRMLPISQTRGAGTDDAATTRTEHDGDGRIVREIDARGNVSTRTIDAFGGTVVEDDPLGHLTLTTYDTASNVTCTRSFELRADGYYLLARDETDYDELGRVLRSGVNRFDDPIDPMQRERTFTYDGLDRLVLTTDPLGNQVATTYDAHHNLIRVDRIDLVRDAATGSILGQRAFASTATFDELDRMLTSTDSLGNTTTFAYDSRNNQVRRVDPLGNVVRIDFDIYNRQIAEHAELRDTGTGDGVIEETTTTRLTYDANGNLTGVVDALGRDTRFMYDALDRRRTIIYPDGSRHASDFDPDNNLTRTTDNNGLRRLYTVDELGRTTGITVDASLLAPGVDVAGATFERYGYDALDRRLAAENDFPLCEVRWSSLGWPLEETTTFTIPAAPLATPLTIVRQFDDAGFVVGLTYPSGRQVRFERDDLDRLVAVRNVANGQGYPGDVNAAASYDIARCGYLGRQRGDATYGNGATVAWAHDGAGRVIETVHTAPAGPILTLQYLFDAAGNVRSRNNIQPPGDAGEVFAYDSLYRLADVDARAIASFPAATLAPAAIIPPTPIPNRQAEIDALIGSLALPAGERTFTYDLVGNRFAERDGEDIDYAVNTLDQYTQVTENTTGAVTNLVHDDNGNLIQDGQRRFVYDSVNRLVRVIDAANDATISIFHHDARGRRMLEIQDGQTTHLQWDGNDLIAEYRAGIPFAQYVFDDGIDRPLQIAAGGGEHWYHTDLVGSVCAMTGRTGAVSATWRYSPFGALTEAPASAPYNPLLYTARRLDDVLGQYDFRAREYSPELGRFLQRDPAGMVDGSNLYAYARNGPLHAIDSFGTERTEVARGQTQPDAGVPDAGHWINPIAGPVGPDNPQVWVRHDDTVLPDAVHSVGQFGRDVVVEGGGWWLRQGERALDTLVWGITGSLDLITRPVAAIEEEVCGPGCFAYNPVGASVSGVRTALTVLSRGLKASRGLKVRKAARAIDRADDVVRGQRPGRVGRVARSGGTGKIPWGTWEDYPKVTVGGKQYAKVGDRLYTEHAVHRIQPGGYRGTSSKWFGGTSSRDSSGGFPQIQQSGGYRTSSGPYTYGRGVPPIWVEEALQAPGVPQANGTISHTLGSLEVIVNKAGAVVTVETY